ncbi:hypothetical protein WCN79_00605 [Xanthomonas axonopodis pv. vasculorum]|uniref:Uncharacterized protein n=1 Tax=Xanthomonas axonopodis pv. vasculorum TaxID=325777 RepID=A0A098PV27_9XANT|nr:hypothetical protein [Xanthomonas axonopodis]KGE50576.1 hypothetical protein GW15_0220295 [Xanthomonas axonopodis pv. vasculorum]PPV10979.1 hypothetical protein XavaCFBP5823_05455 [Xanthomonas axonopodis pv. vasculorum]QKD85320.1 hypothetical protein XAV_01060 [Xanthomonas axonopodis pv. vasculorum]
MPTPIDVAATADEILAHACRDTPEVLKRWLQAKPALWSLQHKPIIGRQLGSSAPVSAKTATTC